MEDQKLNTEVAPIGVVTYPDATLNEAAKLIEVEIVEPDHTSRTHHRNSPSSLPYKAECPGFTSDDTGDKDAAEKGTQLHEYMDGILKRWIADRAKDLLAHLNEFCSGIVIDDLDRGLLVFCVRELKTFVDVPGSEAVNEIKVEIHRGDGTVLTAGHIDVLVLFPMRNTGILIDYKFGWLPVKEADTNEQGISYALGIFERYPNLRTLGVEFIQPRLGRLSRALLKSEDRMRLLDKISVVIERAVYVQKRGINHPEAKPFLKTGSQCQYCKHTVEGTCPARLAVLAQHATTLDTQSTLPALTIEAIDTPEKAALVRYWIEKIEDFLEPAKKRVKEIAEAAPDKRIEVKLKDGTPVVYKMQPKKFDRALGDTLAIRDALADLVTEQELLACADLSLGKLEKVTAEAILEATNGAEDREIQAVEERHRILLASTPPGITKTAAKREISEIRARYKATRLTKEQAKEQFASLLTSQGLLTRPDGVTYSLVRDKSVTKQLTN